MRQPRSLVQRGSVAPGDLLAQRMAVSVSRFKTADFGECVELLSLWDDVSLLATADSVDHTCVMVARAPK